MNDGQVLAYIPYAETRKYTKHTIKGLRRLDKNFPKI